MNNKSFTIIELLVVITVLALISSIIWANLSGTREKARITSNLKFSQTINNTLGAYAVGVWHFDEGFGTAANDRSGYGNNGTLLPAASPPTWTNDTPHAVIGQGAGKWALSFSGANYVNCGSGASLNITDAITIETWVKLNVLGHQYQVGKTNSGCTENGYGISLDPNRKFELIIWGGAGTAIRNAPGGTLAQTGVWYHVVGVCDGAKVYLYLNGNLDRSASGGMPGTIGASSLFLGRVGCGYNTNGLIDEVRIYNRALSAAEIQQRYAEGAARHSIVQLDP